MKPPRAPVLNDMQLRVETVYSLSRADLVKMGV